MPAKSAPKAAAPTKAAGKPAAKAPSKAVGGKPAGKAAGKAAAKVAGKIATKAGAKGAKGKKVVPVVPKIDPRCISRPKSFHLGGDVLPRGAVDVTRFTRWPRYVWRQRRVQILKKRLAVPPAINQFTKTLDADTRKQIFQFAAKYKPESQKERKQRLKSEAAARTVAGKDAAAAKKKPSLRTGLKCVTRLVEHKRAKLVLIASDVSPLELVLFLPALCRKQGIPYAIVKGKALLGKLAGFKEATVLAFDKINEDDAAGFKRILEAVEDKYFNAIADQRRQWGGLVLGRVSQARLKRLNAQLAAQNAAVSAALKHA